MRTKQIIFALAVGWLSAVSCGRFGAEEVASGAFEATEVMVSAQAAGEILRLDAEEGARIEAGRAMGLIDTLQLHLKREQLLAGIRAAEGRMSDVALQTASLRRQLSKQEAEWLRFQNLQRADAATEKQVDDLRSSVEVLEKQLDAQTEALRQGNRALAAEVDALRMQVAQVEDRIGKSVICAPMDGVVLARYAERGELAVEGRALFQIADLNRVYLRAYITADRLAQLSMGQAVQVYADSGTREMKAYEGVLTWVSDQAEFTPRSVLTKNERAHLVYAVKVAVENDGYLKIGMYGELRFR
jgi:HlyD family secretion protein